MLETVASRKSYLVNKTWLNDDEGTQENDTSVVDVKPAPKGTTAAHFIKFVNGFLDIMDEDESLKDSYLVMG